jgi:hypothetical protein
MTIAEAAKLYRKSESTIKRWRALGYPIENEALMRAIISDLRSRRGVSKFAPKQPTDIALEQEEEPNELLEEYLKATSALISAHFAMVHLAWDDDALRQRLKPVFDITRPYVEEPED